MYMQVFWNLVFEKLRNVYETVICLRIFVSIGKKVMEETGEKRSSFYLFQNISIAIQRGNASCVLGTIPHSEGLDEIFEFVTFGDDSERSEGSVT